MLLTFSECLLFAINLTEGLTGPLDFSLRCIVEYLREVIHHCSTNLLIVNLLNENSATDAQHIITVVQNEQVRNFELVHIQLF